MLIAIIDGLVPSELEALMSSLRLDGFICISTNTDITALNHLIAKHRNKPIVLFGEQSLQMPIDDCPRLWLCCGPEIQRDLDVAVHVVKGPIDPSALERRQQALGLSYQCLTYIDAVCFFANAVAKSKAASDW